MVIRALLFLALAAFGFWWQRPPLGLDYGGFWFFLFELALLALWLFGLPALARRRPTVGLPVVPRWLRYALPLLGVLALVMWGSTAPMLHAQRYADLLGTLQDAGSDSTRGGLPALSVERAPLVSESVARKEAETKLGLVDPALGSITRIGALHRQVVNGELVWVGVLEHSGFFAWWRNRATPGYVVVSATDVQRLRVVRELDGQPLKLRYLNSAYWQDLLPRHAYFKGGLRHRLGQAIPELDERGRPFMVVPLIRHEIGLAGPVVDAVLLIDMQTGAVQRHAVDAVPDWVDNVQPERLVYRRLEDWGRYHSGGWLNPSQQGRLQTSTWQLDLVTGEDGRSYWVTGLTSVGRDTSLTGIVLVDTRSGAARRFALSGVIEEEATAIMEQAWREKGYRASNPTPLQVDGTPAYVTALTDVSGATQAYAVLGIQNKELLGTGNTLATAIRAFQSRRLGQERTAALQSAGPERHEGVVARIAASVRSGSTVFHLTLQSQPTRLFTAAGDLSEELPLTQPGDSVQLEAIAAGAVHEIRRFDNRALGEP